MSCRNVWSLCKCPNKPVRPVQKRPFTHGIETRFKSSPDIGDRRTIILLFLVLLWSLNRRCGIWICEAKAHATTLDHCKPDAVPWGEIRKALLGIYADGLSRIGDEEVRRGVVFTVESIKSLSSAISSHPRGGATLRVLYTVAKRRLLELVGCWMPMSGSINMRSRL
jgi:hypothetical protein